MIEEDYKKRWQQHFPTYHFDNRDIALEEYKVAAKNLELEERVFLNASNVTLVSSAALGSLLVGSSGQLIAVFSGIIPPYIISLILLSIIIGFSFMMPTQKVGSKKFKGVPKPFRRLLKSILVEMVSPFSFKFTCFLKGQTFCVAILL